MAENEKVDTELRCCGGGDFYGHQPYCDCGHVLAEKATAKYIDEMHAVLTDAVGALQAVNNGDGVFTGVIVRAHEILSREKP